MGGSQYPERVRRAKCLEREDEVLVYFDRHQRGYVLNPSARAIWDACDGTRSLEAISEELEDRLSLPRGSLLDDVNAAVSDLAKAELVTITAGCPRPSVKSTVRWENLAEPRPDLEDLKCALAVLDERRGHAAPQAPWEASGEASLIADGGLRIRYSYDDIPADLRPAPLDHEHIAQALSLLRRWPTGQAQFRFLITTLHPLLDPSVPNDKEGWFTTSRCHSGSDLRTFGTMWSTVNCPVFLAENLVHELAHQKLYAIGIYKESKLGLVTNSDEHRYRSPVIRDRLRPMTAVIHGVYAYMYVVELDLHLIETEADPELRERLRKRLACNVDRIAEGTSEIRAHLTTDDQGGKFFHGFHDWADRLIARGSALGSGRKAYTAQVMSSSTANTHNDKNPRVPCKVLDPITVFVGTDPRQAKADTALANSIRRVTTGPFRIVWADYSRGEPWDGWDIGRQRGQIPEGSGPGWPTEFSAFRFAVPEAHAFAGRAVYLDSDMIVLRDLRQLYDISMEKPWLVTSSCPATMLIDTAKFGSASWWPRLAQMKRSGWSVGRYLELLSANHVLGDLDVRWNCHDGRGFVQGETGIVHFTSRRRQPWRPYPEVFKYEPPALPEMEALWWSMYLNGQAGQGAWSALLGAAYSRGQPSTHYAVLVDQYLKMHLELGDQRGHIAPKHVYRGMSIAPHVREIGDLIRQTSSKSVLDYGSGKGLQYRSTIADMMRSVKLAMPLDDGAAGQSLADFWSVEGVTCYDPGYPPSAALPTGTFDGVICTDVLEHCAEEDLEWILREIFEYAKRFVFISVNCGSAKKVLPNGENAHRTIRSPEWWSVLIAHVAQSYPSVEYHVTTESIAVSKRRKTGKRPKETSHVER